MKKYYYIDLHLNTMKIVKWGESDEATHTGETGDPHTYRIFLTKGQFNKLVKRLD